MQLSKHFRAEEFECRHCNQGTVHPHIIAILELVRHYFQQPVYVTSGYRCTTHNHNVGGAPRSFHLSGQAVDFAVADIKPHVVAEFLREVFPNDYGIEAYENAGFVHVDLGEKRTWKN